MILSVKVNQFITTNAYFYVDDETKHGFLIDPGDEAGKLLNIIEDNGFIIEKILLTHGHFDHIGAVNEINYKLMLPVFMQKNGADYVENPSWSFSEGMTLSNVHYLEDGDIKLNGNPNFKLQMISTPGHTTDGAIYYSDKDKIAFVGDTIFKASYGRYDLPGGDIKALFESIKKKILTLPDETILYPGHGDSTTVADEKTRSWFN